MRKSFIIGTKTSRKGHYDQKSDGKYTAKNEQPLMQDIFQRSYDYYDIKELNRNFMRYHMMPIFSGEK